MINGVPQLKSANSDHYALDDHLGANANDDHGDDDCDKYDDDGGHDDDDDDDDDDWSRFGGLAQLPPRRLFFSC